MASERLVLGAARRAEGGWIGEQMRSTIAKPDVLRLLIPDMADSIIHRFANSSNIRAGAAIAACNPLRRGSRPRRVRMYCTGCAWMHRRLHVRAYPHEWFGYIYTRQCTFTVVRARARVKLYERQRLTFQSTTTSSLLSFDVFLASPRRFSFVCSSLRRYSGIYCQLSRIAETASQLPGVFARLLDPPLAQAIEDEDTDGL